MRTLHTCLLYICILSISFLMLSCATDQSRLASSNTEQVPYKVISGTVMYPNNLYFPARVRMEIKLIARNISTQQEVPIVSQSIRNPQRFPVNFILRYDAQDIIRSNEYAITVELYREIETTPYLISPSLVLPTLQGDESIVVELQPPPR
ncbi:MAG: YbaY family lipoprotein [Sphaerochaetaceae bacterium]